MQSSTTDLIIVGDQLKVDVDATRKSVEQSNQEAFALAMGISYPTKDTIKPLLQLAHQKAVALAVAGAIPTKDTIGDLIAKSQRGNDKPKRRSRQSQA